MADELFYDPDEDKYYTKEELDNAGFDYDVVGTPTPGPVPIPQPEESTPQEIGPPPIPEDVQQFIGPQEPTDPNAPGWLERAFLTTQLGGENLMSGVLGLSKRGVEALGGETKGIDSWLQGIDDLRQQDQARMGETNTLEDVASGAISFVPSMLSGAGALGMTAQQSGMGYGRTYDRLLNEGAPQDKAREGASWGAAGEAIANLPFFSAMKSSLKPLAKYATSALAGGAGGVVGSASDMAATNIGTGKTFTQEEFGDALLKGAKTGFASGLAFTGVHDAVGALKSRAKAIKDYSEINRFKDIIDQAPDEVPPPDVPEPKPEEIVPPPEPKPEPITKTVDIDATKPGQTFDKPIEQRIATEGTEVVTQPKSKLLELPGRAIKAAAEIPGYLKSRLTGKVIDDRPPVEKFLAADANWLPKPAQDLLNYGRRKFTLLTTLADKGSVEAKSAVETTRKLAQDKEAVAFDLRETLDPYLALKDRTNVDRALAAGRLSNKPYVGDQTLATLGLTPEEIGAYRAVHKTMDQSLNLLEEALRTDGQHLSQEIDNPSDPTAESPFRRYQGAVSEFIGDLRNQGYVPFSRYGDAYEVRGTTADGKPYYDRFDSKRKAIVAARELSKQAGQTFDVQKIGRVDSTAYDNFGPDFAGALKDFDPDKWTDRARAKEPRGFSKHLVRAKLVPGFETDLARPISDYVLGLANFYAHKKAAPAFRDILSSLPDGSQTKGFVKRFVEDLKKPSSGTQNAINFLNLYYLAGVPSSALTNLTQTTTTTWPQFTKELRGKGGVARATMLLGKSSAMAGDYLTSRILGKHGTFDKRNPEISNMLRDFERRGVIDANATRDLIGHRNNLAGDKPIGERLMFMFSGVEKFNRLTAAIGAYEIAKVKGLEGKAAYKYAEDLVYKTQFDQTKFNRPEIARSPLGRSAFQFKLFTGNYFRFLRNNMTPQDAHVVGLSLAAMGAWGGLVGIPLAKEAENIADKMGFNPRRALREYLGDNRKASAWLYGLPTLLNENMSGAAGTAEILQDIDRDPDRAIAQAFLGTGYDLAGKKIPKSIELASRRGSFPKGLALENILPRFLRNPAKASRAVAMGGLESVDPTSLPVLENPDSQEAISLALGVPPNRMVEGYERNNELYKESKRLREASGDYNKDIARALANGDREGALAILEEMIAQGQEDPSLAVEPDISSIMNYLMKKESPETSVIKSVPDRGRGNMIDIIDLYKRR